MSFKQKGLLDTAWLQRETVVYELKSMTMNICVMSKIMSDPIYLDLPFDFKRQFIKVKSF